MFGTNQSTIATTFVGKDEVSKVVNGIRGNFQKLGADVKQGIGLAFGFSTVGMITRAGEAVTGFFTESIQKYKEHEVAIHRLDTSLDANVAGWRAQSAAIDGAIKSGTNLGFTETATAEALAAIAPATHSVAESIKVLNVAQDLARFKGISLQEAAQALVKVEAGRYRVLATLGIAQKTFASQEEALAAVEAVAAGQAIDYTTTLAGKEDVLNAKMEAQQELIGQKLVPAQLAWNSAVLAGVTAVGDFTSGYEEQKQALVETPKNNFLATLPSKQDVQAALDKLRNITFTDPNTGETNYFQKMLFDLNVGGVKDSWQKQIDDLNKYLATHAFTDTGASVEKGLLGSGATALDNYMQFLTSRIPPDTTNFVTNLSQAIGSNGQTLAHSADQLAGAWDARWKAVMDKEAQQAGGPLPAEIGKAIDANKDDVNVGMKALMDLINHPLKRQKEIARIEGALSSKGLAEGLASNDPLIHGVAVAEQAHLQAQWALLKGEAYTAGSKTGGAFISAYRDALRTPILQHVILQISGSGVHIFGGNRAEGGSVYEGMAYHVGEKGPETFIAPSNGYILPAHAGGSPATLDSGHGHVIMMDGWKVGRALDERNGRDVAQASSYGYIRG